MMVVLLLLLMCLIDLWIRGCVPVSALLRRPHDPPLGLPTASAHALHTARRVPIVCVSTPPHLGQARRKTTGATDTHRPDGLHSSSPSYQASISPPLAYPNDLWPRSTRATHQAAHTAHPRPLPAGTSPSALACATPPVPRDRARTVDSETSCLSLVVMLTLSPSWFPELTRLSSSGWMRSGRERRSEHLHERSAGWGWTRHERRVGNGRGRGAWRICSLLRSCRDECL